MPISSPRALTAPKGPQVVPASHKRSLNIWATKAPVPHLQNHKFRRLMNKTNGVQKDGPRDGRLRHRDRVAQPMEDLRKRGDQDNRPGGPKPKGPLGWGEERKPILEGLQLSEKASVRERADSKHMLLGVPGTQRTQGLIDSRDPLLEDLSRGKPGRTGSLRKELRIGVVLQSGLIQQPGMVDLRGLRNLEGGMSPRSRLRVPESKGRRQM